MAVKIITDSGSDIPKDLRERFDVNVIPFNVILGDKEYLDGVSLTTEMIYQYVAETNKLPKTAAIGPMIYREYFEKLQADGSEVVYIGLSSGISVSFSNAEAVTKEMKGVYAVDSKSLSSGMALLVLYACELRDAGMSAADIAKNVSRRADAVQCSFVLDNVEFLHKGGRCSGLTRFLSTLLKIKPTIIMKHKMEVGKKYMGNWANSVSKYAEDTFIRAPEPDLKRVFITYTTAPQSFLDGVKAQVLKKFDFKEVIFSTAQGTISSHCGKNTLGILYMGKDEKEGLS